MTLGITVEIQARLGAFGEIEERFFDEQDLVLFRKPRKELLRALPDETPAQVAEDDDAVAVDGLCVVDLD